MNIKPIIIAISTGSFFAISMLIIGYLFNINLLWEFLFTYILIGAYNVYFYKILIDNNLSRAQATQIGIITSVSFLVSYFLIAGIIKGQLSLDLILISLFASIFSLFFSVIFATILIKPKKGE